MFDIPQPLEPDPNAYIESCPIVEMQDSAYDLEYIISIFYDNIRHHMREPMKFKDIAALLRLGKKYEIGHFQDEALRRLRHDLPSTYNTWEAQLGWVYCQDVCQILEVWNFYPQIISLAHEIGLETILPAAYLCLIQSQSVENILQGKFQWVGQTCNRSVQESDQETTIYSFPQSAVHACLIGRDKLLCEIQKTYIDWFQTDVVLPGEDCTTPSECQQEKAETLASLTGMKFFDDIKAMDFDTDFNTETSVCSSCKRSVKDVIQQNRMEIWSRLPSIFGLPDWEDLEDFDM
ncbi:hypothetical protein JR316_0008324 [Psilocybe cubensis]|uniref:Uncharacterized protein n=2 Tax=Psilocybe cubensis TaxID=181762 RepID=A0A8H7XTU7_PSICU|nr:hypothetical protein JR316_0008324 [Psilocybe cubensis]KAH9479729.1 hypothetical protein JR316_0008324 [Psilocybe cubensis]